jgi:N utilization substance protein A
LFEKLTNARVIDCIDTPDKLIFIVSQGKIGAVLGKKGENIRRLSKKFQRNLDVIEYSDDPIIFLKNIFHNFKVTGVDIKQKGTKTHATVIVNCDNKGNVIGKDGKNLRLAKEILKRHHNIEGLSIA